MNTIFQIASLLIDKLHSLLSLFTQYINLNNEEEYKIFFEVFHQAVHHKPLLLENIYKDVRLLRILHYTRKFLDYVSELVDKRNVDIHALAREMLRRTYMILTEVSKGRSKYVIVCDGMSIIDTVYIAYKLKKEHMEPFITVLINPGGITETYKLILKPYNYLQNTNFTLDDIARKIAEEIRAKNAIVFRGYDKSIHQLRDVPINDVVDKMHTLTLKLYNKIIQLKSEFNGIIIVLSDHGYDIIEREMNLYETKHFWRPHSLSVIAPLLVV